MVALREFADDRRRRGLELLPAERSELLPGREPVELAGWELVRVLHAFWKSQERAGKPLRPDVFRKGLRVSRLPNGQLAVYLYVV